MIETEDLIIGFRLEILYYKSPIDERWSDKKGECIVGRVFRHYATASQCN